jgi:small-conductance mechanosensitive channel
MFPYLPGGDSPAFRGISIFIGVLVSLGSSSAMGNLIAGIILTYMHPYRVGDRVRISDTVGDVRRNPFW